MAKNTYGTGCFLLMNTGTTVVSSKNNLLTTVAWKIGNETTYALEGSVFIGGALVQWLRDEMGLISTASECDQLAATVPDSGGLYIVPAFTGLGAPYWDPDARGIAVGITRGTNKAHFCRAALDAIAFQTTELIHSMEKDSGINLKALRVDGGASRSDPLLQFQADLLQSDVVRPECVETTAWGAACLAGLAVGFWDNLRNLSDHWIEEKHFTPILERSVIEATLSDWKRAVQRSLQWNEPEP
jgi:glycerol kinase